MEEETCNCRKIKSLVLQFDFTDNPIACSQCNLTVGLNNISPELKNKIEKWNRKYEVEYRAFLETDDEIEALKNPSSELNVLGYSIVSDFNEIIPAYYWWHLEENEKTAFCPKCKMQLENSDLLKLGVNKTCEKCMILIRE